MHLASEYIYLPLGKGIFVMKYTAFSLSMMTLLTACGGSNNSDDPAVSLNPVTTYDDATVVLDELSYTGEDMALNKGQQSQGNLDANSNASEDRSHQYLFTAQDDDYALIRLQGSTGTDFDLIIEDLDVLSDTTNYGTNVSGSSDEYAVFMPVSGHQYQLSIYPSSDDAGSYTLIVSALSKSLLGLDNDEYLVKETGSYSTDCVLSTNNGTFEGDDESIDDLMVMNFQRAYARDVYDSAYSEVAFDSITEMSFMTSLETITSDTTETVEYTYNMRSGQAYADGSGSYHSIEELSATSNITCDGTGTTVLEFLL